MNDLAMKAVKAQASSTLNTMKAQMINQSSGNLSNIKWNEYNYPPLLRLIHYDLDELDDERRSLVRKINWTFLIIPLIGVINIIDCIAQAAGPDDYDKLNVLYSFLNIVIFTIPAFYAFYKGYLGVCKETSNIRWYQIIQGILCIAWFVFSIVFAGAINGFVRTGQLFSAGYGFQGILSLFESILYLADCFLGIFCIWRVRQYQ